MAPFKDIEKIPYKFFKIYMDVNIGDKSEKEEKSAYDAFFAEGQKFSRTADTRVGAVMSDNSSYYVARYYPTEKIVEVEKQYKDEENKTQLMYVPLHEYKKSDEIETLYNKKAAEQNLNTIFSFMIVGLVLGLIPGLILLAVYFIKKNKIQNEVLEEIKADIQKIMKEKVLEPQDKVKNSLVPNNDNPPPLPPNAQSASVVKRTFVDTDDSYSSGDDNTVPLSPAPEHEQNKSTGSTLLSNIERSQKLLELKEQLKNSQQQETQDFNNPVGEHEWSDDNSSDYINKKILEDREAKEHRRKFLEEQQKKSREELMKLPCTEISDKINALQVKLEKLEKFEQNFGNLTQNEEAQFTSLKIQIKKFNKIIEAKKRIVSTDKTNLTKITSMLTQKNLYKQKDETQQNSSIEQTEQNSSIEQTEQNAFNKAKNFWRSPK